MSNAGRKSLYDHDTFPLLAQGYARDGLNDEQIAEKLGIKKTAFYEYQKRHTEFAEAIKEGKKPVDREIENALHKRARGYEFEEVTKEVRTDDLGKKTMHVKTVVKKVPPDPTSMIFWLKNRKPDKWRDKREMDIQGDGLQISITLKEDE